MTASTVSTRCRAWVLTRTDGVIMGFTDHDRALAFVDPTRGAVTLEPATGFIASQFAESVGLMATDMEIKGALSSDRITLADLANGVYDGAEVRIYWLDWSNLANYDLINVSRIAEVPRNQAGFTAALEGLAGARAAEPRGLRLTRTCVLKFGGAVDVTTGIGCGIDLDAAGFSELGTVGVVISPRSFSASAITLPAGRCDFGKVIWTSGANAGARTMVRSHTVRGALAVFDFDLAPLSAMQPGDGFRAVAGCDRTVERCKEYSNMARRLAFPMPNNDVAVKYDATPPEGE